MSPLLRLYLGFSLISQPLWRLSHRKRLKRGKELPDRLPEKYGKYGVARPAGPLLWFHALSVGESLALLPLIELALEELPDAHVVLTTSTATSVAALEKAKMPKRAQHVLLPIDTARATRAFLDHWRPDIAAFAELDFWPRLMVETNRRGTPMVLVNSRMPEHNFVRRKKLGGLTRDIVRLFDSLLVQDEASARRFVALGVEADRIQTVGALKAAARPLPADEGTLSAIRAAMCERPLWLAAATEAREHGAMLEAHRIVSEAIPDALLVVAPRFPNDADALSATARQLFPNVARRSQGEEPDDTQDVYIADTIGEMGLWYRLSPVSFIGHSLFPGLEGKNPFEAAALGSAILHGPHTSYFEESYAALSSSTREVTSAQDLGETVTSLLQSSDTVLAMTRGAEQVIAEKRSVLHKTWATLCSHLPASAGGKQFFAEKLPTATTKSAQ